MIDKIEFLKLLKIFCLNYDIINGSYPDCEYPGSVFYGYCLTTLKRQNIKDIKLLKCLKDTCGHYCHEGCPAYESH